MEFLDGMHVVEPVERVKKIAHRVAGGIGFVARLGAETEEALKHRPPKRAELERAEANLKAN